MAWDDDDDWVGEPPEGRHSASRADPGFWWRNVPVSLAAVGIFLVIVVILIVWLL